MHRGAAGHPHRAARSGPPPPTQLATADAIVYATALEHGADVLTCDAHFTKLSEVAYFRKSAGSV